MAKIDVSGIENYQNMTPEEKVKVLEGLDIPESRVDNEETIKLKNALNKASSDVAAYKKKLQEHMSDEERKEAERKEAQEKMEQELNSLRHEKTVSGYKASYLSMGYPEELAESTAKALAEGDTATVFANQRTFMEDTKKALVADNLGKQPPLPQGKPLSSKDIEEQTQQKLREAMLNV